MCSFLEIVNANGMSAVSLAEGSTVLHTVSEKRTGQKHIPDNVFYSAYQEAGEGNPVSDREGLCFGHTSRHREVRPGEERSESSDDRRVPGQQAAVQQGRARVRTASSHQ